MVGVPSSLGCSSCRLQKKKCVVASKPPCSRCERLQIKCSGYGKRRLKFQDESTKFASRSLNDAGPRSNRPGTQVAAPGPVSMPQIPTSALTTLTGAFVRCMASQGSDASFHLPRNFGAFLTDVPRHLGRSEALDSASDALVAGYSHFRRARRTNVSQACLSKYIAALGCLRRSLLTTDTACEAETLCAIMILMVVETLIGAPLTGSLQHAGGAAQIFKCRGIRPPASELERKMLFTLRGPVVFQAFCLPLSYFSPAEWSALLCAYCPEGPFGEEEVFFRPFANTARLFQRTRKVLSEASVDRDEVDDIAFQANLVYENLARQAPSPQQLVQIYDSGARSSSNLDDIYGFRSYGWMLITKLLLNGILSVLCGASAAEENERLCWKICELAECPHAKWQRPLGALWLQMALYVAYAGARTEGDRRRIHMLLEEYTSDFIGVRTVLERSPFEVMASYMSFRDLIPNSSP